MEANLKPKVVIKGKSINMTQSNNNSVVPIVIGVALMVLAGIGTGYFFAGSNAKKGISISETGARTVDSETVVGSFDERFKDEAEGLVVEGGIDGEGSHHLERDGGSSQDVYMTSLVVPLDEYIGKKVRVWGETNKANKAGWLMDVGRLEIIE